MTPYTNAAHNVDSDIVFVLQDWSSVEAIEELIKGKRLDEVVEKGYDKRRSTNKRFKKLLRDYLKKEQCKEFEDIFVTNLFPYIKEGKINAGIPEEYLRMAYGDFLEPQVDIVKPKAVVCLGRRVSKAIPDEIKLEKEDCSGKLEIFKVKEITYFGLYHPAAPYIRNQTRNEQWSEFVKRYNLLISDSH